MKSSINRRLAIGLSSVLIILLSFAGIALDSAFTRSIEKAVQARLQLYVYVILAAAQEADQGLTIVKLLQEPRFNQINSGLYGLITDELEREAWRSPSAEKLQRIPLASVNPGETEFNAQIIDTTTQEKLYYLGVGVLWEDMDQNERLYTFTVAEDATPYAQEIADFRQQLWLSFSVISLFLLIFQQQLLRWGLSPLRRLAWQLRQIENGQQDHLEGHYPLELATMTDNLNDLLASERRQRERYRNTLADLAHSLKTPLAVLRGSMREVKIEKLKHVLDQQVERINQIVSYQLRRAVGSYQGQMGRFIKMGPILTELIQALNKVYLEKQMQVLACVAEDAVFFGDKGDLMELLGNIIENAYKYGQSKIHINITMENEVLAISVADDGPGIDPDERERVLTRGVRVDTQAQGQGIGLAVVRDIVNSYQGRLMLDQSTLGGALIELKFSRYHVTH